MDHIIEPKLSSPAQITESYALLFHLFEDGNMAVIRHAVRQTAKGPEIGAGMPMTWGHLETLVNILANKSVSGGLLPENVLALSPSCLAWFVRGAVRKMWFQGAKGAESIVVPWPNLVFVATGKDLYVAAYKGNRRPTAKTRLYHAPIMNIWGEGRVCIGSGTIPKGIGLEDMRGWEAIIYDTLFTHVNHQRTLAPKLRRTRKAAKVRESKDVSNAQHRQFWNALHRKKAKRFPPEALVPMHRSVEDFVRRGLA